MPPKKEGIYLADYDDSEAYFKIFNKELYERIGEFNSVKDYNPFKTTPKFFNNIQWNNTNLRIVQFLFFILDTCSANDVPSYRACRNGIELSLLDLIGLLLEKPLCEIAGISRVPKKCFYTVSLDPSIENMLKDTEFGISHTPFIKIKLNKDIKFCKDALEKILQYLNDLKSKDIIKQFNIMIDANSDWTPDVAREYLTILENIKENFSILEQPFPWNIYNLPRNEQLEWIDVKKKYEQRGFKIYADESVSIYEDVENLIEFCHGINIKLDKTGGIREALRVITKAQEYKLDIWFGIMVSSRLTNTATSCLLPLTNIGGDLDGQLLIDENCDKFTGGMRWDYNTGLVTPPEGYGLGLIKKKEDFN